MPEPSRTIRVSRSTHTLIRDLAARSNATITAVVDRAVRDLQKKSFWDEFNAQCDAIRADPGAWAVLRREDAAWDATLADGFPPARVLDADRRGLGGGPGAGRSDS